MRAGSASLIRESCAMSGHEFIRGACLARAGATKWTRSLGADDHIAVVQDLIELLASIAPLLDFAYIRPSFLMQFRNVEARVPGWSNARARWNALIPQVNGVQLLTKEHLSSASNLRDWEVSEVAPDRFLVVAKDLAAWFRPRTPEEWSLDGYSNEELMLRANATFGAVLFRR
jgi:hypothetical protein